jgi:phosphatidylserine decarboxylase
MLKFAPEGYPFIIFFAVLAMLVLFAGGIVPALVPLALTAFMLYFFRDPVRKVPKVKDVFVSPADGRVILIRDLYEPEYLNADIRQVSIFMSPFDVHVNRVPCDGRVKKVKHNKGCFFAAYKEDACIRNENIAMVLETEYGDILVRQVAGFLARRAVCRKKEGDILGRGDRYGMIKFSSRVDLYLPKDTFLKVKEGEKVKAGETVIGEIAS